MTVNIYTLNTPQGEVFHLGDPQWKNIQLSNAGFSEFMREHKYRSRQ